MRADDKAHAQRLYRATIRAADPRSRKRVAEGGKRRLRSAIPSADKSRSRVFTRAIRNPAIARGVTISGVSGQAISGASPTLLRALNLKRRARLRCPSGEKGKRGARSALAAHCLSCEVKPNERRRAKVCKGKVARQAERQVSRYLARLDERTSISRKRCWIAMPCTRQRNARVRASQ